MSDEIQAPIERRLYHFTGYDDGSYTTESEYVGWWTGRHWVAVFGDGMWSENAVTSWRPLGSPS